MEGLFVRLGLGDERLALLLEDLDLLNLVLLGRLNLSVNLLELGIDLYQLLADLLLARYQVGLVLSELLDLGITGTLYNAYPSVNAHGSNII